MFYDVYFRAGISDVVSYLAMAFSYFFILIFATISQPSIIQPLQQNVLRFIPKNHEKGSNLQIETNDYGPPRINKGKEDLMDIKSAKLKSSVIKAVRERRKDPGQGVLENVIKKSGEKQLYHLDPLLNIMRRKNKKSRESFSSDTSSSIELRNWKDEWREHWLQKKFEAINSSRPAGDTVNMAAARPWGQPCGDPNQHDMPWGTCMLPMECDAEYRIFRGDYFCGRTEFICCALQLTTYDMYQGFDVSFDDSSLGTDSEEKRNRNRDSREKRKRKSFRNKQRRRRDRLKRKRKIKRNIRRIVRQIKKILHKHYRNGTTERGRKTRQLKKFIKTLKKKFKEERRVIKDLHEIQIINADAQIQNRLNQIKGLNEEFMKNETFRDIIVNGTVNKKDDLRALLEGYPELASVLQTRREGVRRPRDYLEYDIEYGYLYY